MYIRTKDGVYEIDKNTKGTEDFFWVKTNKANIVQCVWLNCIINQSENLEELCDLYIDEETQTIFHKHNGYVINWKTNMVYSLNELANYFHSVKGVIYTDKGLIYVAKMDNEGKLVLI